MLGGVVQSSAPGPSKGETMIARHEPGARLYHDLADEARDDQETPRTDVLIQCVNGPLPLEEILPWLVNLHRGIYKFESCALAQKETR